MTFVASGILPVMPRSCSKASRFVFVARPVEQQDLVSGPPNQLQNLYLPENSSATSCFVTSFVKFERWTMMAMPSQAI